MMRSILVIGNLIMVHVNGPKSCKGSINKIAKLLRLTIPLALLGRAQNIKNDIHDLAVVNRRTELCNHLSGYT